MVLVAADPWVETHGYHRASRCDGWIVPNDIPWVLTHGLVNENNPASRRDA